jgi:hypothetical protein
VTLVEYLLPSSDPDMTLVGSESTLIGHEPDFVNTVFFSQQWLDHEGKFEFQYVCNCKCAKNVFVADTKNSHLILAFYRSKTVLFSICSPANINVFSFAWRGASA